MHLNDPTRPAPPRPVEPATRRRGAELEAALLDAVWDVATQRGYSALTFEAVAAQAGTSRPVVHRRWATRQEMLLAAVRHRGAQQVPVTADTGSLRGDLRSLLHDFSHARAQTVFILLQVAWDLHHDAGLAPADLREHWVGDRGTAMRQVVDRALARGEVDPARVTDRTVRLATDLMRHEMLMTMAPIDDATIDEIVDEVILPLLRGCPDRGRLG